MDFNKIKEKIRYIIQFLSEKLDESLKSERERRAIFIGVGAIIALILFVSFNTFFQDSNKYQKHPQVRVY